MPYSLSPTIGNPANGKWTRIWWVRPVTGFARTTAEPPPYFLKKFKARFRGFAVFRVNTILVANKRTVVLADRRCIGPGRGPRDAFDNGNIFLVHCPERKGVIHHAQAFFVFCQQNDARCFAIKPVYDVNIAHSGRGHGSIVIDK